jgi:hypothetical protein
MNIHFFFAKYADYIARKKAVFANYFYGLNMEKQIKVPKAIVSLDFDGIFMILSYSLDVRQFPLDILFFF